MSPTPAVICDGCGWQIIDICTNGDCPKPKPDLWTGICDPRDPVGYVPGLTFGASASGYRWHRFVMDPEERAVMPRLGRRRKAA